MTANSNTITYLLKRVLSHVFLYVYCFSTNAQWNSLPSFPGGARDDAYGISAQDTIYIGGGRDAGFGFPSDFWKYHNNRWERLDDSPFTARQYAQIASYGDSVWMAGGSRQTEYYSDVWLYRPSLRKWMFHSQLPRPIRQGVIFAPNGVLIAGLGEHASNQLSDSIFIFKEGKWNGLTVLPTGGRFRCGFFHIGQRLYVGWGKNQDNQIAEDWWVYDILANTWDTLPSPKGEPREWCSSTSQYKGSGAVGFGMNQREEFQHDVFHFDPIANNWEAIPNRDSLRGTVMVGMQNQLHLITGLSNRYNRLDIHEKWKSHETKNAHLHIFPNPASRYLHIRYQPSVSMTWKIMDTSGKIIREIFCDFGSCEIQLFGIQSGLYFITNGEITRKIHIASY